MWFGGTWDLKCTVYTVQNASMHPADRHAVLADPTRRALLDALRATAGPLAVRALADRLALHPNSVREQLRRLEEAGLVRASLAAPSGRGRPGLRFESVPEPEDPYRVLAGVLADEVAALPDAPARLAAAGQRWGRAAAGAARDAAPAGVPPEPMALVAGLLEEAGFAPEPIAADDDEVRLRACPFLPIERRRLPAVCGVHLGFLRGALRELGSPRDAVSIEPFVRPGLCVARLQELPRA
jgi:predicted ArsR family transcriptional regulator